MTGRVLGFLGALLVGATAGWALLAPLASSFGFVSSDGQLQAVATSRSIAAAIGMVLAAAVAGSLARRGAGARSAWVTATLGLVLVAAAGLTNEHVRQIEWSIAANYLSGIGAGLALGGVAAVLGRRLGIRSGRAASAALAGGAFAAFLLAPSVAFGLDRGWGWGTGGRVNFGWTGYAPLTDADAIVTAPPWWLLLPALACAIAAATIGRGEVAEPSTRGVAATVVVVVTALATNAAIGVAPDNWALAAPLLAVFALAVGAAAFALDGRDGRLVLTTTAVVATAAPLLGGTDTNALGIVIIAASLAAGVTVGVRFPKFVVGLALLAAINTFGLLPDFDDGMRDAVRWLALAPIAGYALGSCVPVRGGAAVAGLSVLFVPSALTVAGQSAESDWFGASSVFTELPRGLLSAPPADPKALSLAAALVAGAAVVAAVRLGRRPANPTS
ncbi:hypothetical protein [Rhodococcus sp. NPDC127528]|uniref:hypothetical protein n=1 Tax=unclassified Rhodococcus (in: high G+C Gram-positive bacteria) TaxID=192944 RepID=UPI003631EB29